MATAPDASARAAAAASAAAAAAAAPKRVAFSVVSEVGTGAAAVAAPGTPRLDAPSSPGGARLASSRAPEALDASASKRRPPPLVNADGVIEDRRHHEPPQPVSRHGGAAETAPPPAPAAPGRAERTRPPRGGRSRPLRAAAPASARARAPLATGGAPSADEAPEGEQRLFDAAGATLEALHRGALAHLGAERTALLAPSMSPRGAARRAAPQPELSEQQLAEMPAYMRPKRAPAPPAHPDAPSHLAAHRFRNPTPDQLALCREGPVATLSARTFDFGVVEPQDTDGADARTHAPRPPAEPWFPATGRSAPRRRPQSATARAVEMGGAAAPQRAAATDRPHARPLSARDKASVATLRATELSAARVAEQLAALQAEGGADQSAAAHASSAGAASRPSSSVVARLQSELSALQHNIRAMREAAANGGTALPPPAPAAALAGRRTALRPSSAPRERPRSNARGLERLHRAAVDRVGREAAAAPHAPALRVLQPADAAADSSLADHLADASTAAASAPRLAALEAALRSYGASHRQAVAAAELRATGRFTAARFEAFEDELGAVFEAGGYDSDLGAEGAAADAAAVERRAELGHRAALSAAAAAAGGGAAARTEGAGEVELQEELLSRYRTYAPTSAAPPPPGAGWGSLSGDRGAAAQSGADDAVSLGSLAGEGDDELEPLPEPGAVSEGYLSDSQALAAQRAALYALLQPAFPARGDGASAGVGGVRARSAPRSRPGGAAHEPAPFSFVARDAGAHRKKSISSARLEAELALRAEVEAAELSRRFRANPLPRSTLEPRFARMAEEQAALRELRKRDRMERLHAEERPFSFYAREKEAAAAKEAARAAARAERLARLQRPFRAGPIPASTLEKRYHRQQAEDAAREARIAALARAKLEQAALPQRMQQWADAAAAGTGGGGAPAAKAGAPAQQRWSFRPRPARPIPDFKALQARFEAELAAARVAKKGTVPQEFRLGGSKPPPPPAQPAAAASGKTSAHGAKEDVTASLVTLRWPYLPEPRLAPQASAASSVGGARPGSAPAAAVDWRAQENRATRMRRELVQQELVTGAYDGPSSRDERALGKREVTRRAAPGKAGAGAAAAAPSTVGGATPAAEIPGVPAAHVEARHKQMEERAREAVEEIMLRQGLVQYLDGPQAAAEKRKP